MTDRAPVSVIIPAYNGEDFIIAAIQSVLAQTLPVAEIIVVDDGSSDRTAAVAERFGAMVIRQANRGVSAARNAGIRAANTEWIALLDQDDIWAPKKIEYQLGAVRLHPNVGIVSCHMSWFEPDAPEECSTVTETDLPDESARTEDSVPRIKYFPHVHNQLPFCRTTDNPSSVIIRRDLLLAAGLFDETLRQNEDLDCFLKVITLCPLAIVEQSLIRHRVHVHSRSKDTLESGLSFIRVFDKLCAEPDKYPPGAAEAYGACLRRMLIPFGRSLLEGGRAREARALFARSFKMSYSHRALIFWGLAFLGPAIFRQLVKIKTGLGCIGTQRQFGRSSTRAVEEEQYL